MIINGKSKTYVQKESIGQGGFSSIYLVEEKETHEKYNIIVCKIYFFYIIFKYNLIFL